VILISVREILELFTYELLSEVQKKMKNVENSHLVAITFGYNSMPKTNSKLKLAIVIG